MIKDNGHAALRALMFSICISEGNASLTLNSAITLELNGGRLGDNLVAYARAKWVSIKYNLPLFCIPFENMEAFAFASQETFINNEIEKSYQQVIKITKENENCIYDQDKTLYRIPYFAEFAYERAYYPSSASFEISWEDAEFKRQLRNLLQPSHPITTITVPKDVISVAIHVRRGGEWIYDDAPTKYMFPQRFAPDSFYIQGLKHIYSLYPNKRFYVYIFTDDPNPEAIAKKYKNAIPHDDVEFDFRKDRNRHDLNVLEDFFSMQKCMCLIRPQSNFSFLAAKLHDYVIEIFPTHATHTGNGWIIDQFEIVNNQLASRRLSFD